MKTFKARPQRRWQEYGLLKYLVELSPPPEMKKEFEKTPDLQKKVGETFQRMKPLAAWFTHRYGFVVVEANSNDELNTKLAPLVHLFRADVKASPAFDLDEFPKIVGAEESGNSPSEGLCC
jgi:hypothetical protein